MNSGTTAGLLQLISAAVTPVVMISACAALILGINNAHTGISDRIRLLIGECRQATEERRQQLREQLPLFYRRFLLSWYALIALYMAVGAFLLTTMLLLITQKHLTPAEPLTLGLFIIGIALMLLASALELVQISLAVRSLRIEARDIIPFTGDLADTEKSRR